MGVLECLDCACWGLGGQVAAAVLCCCSCYVGMHAAVKRRAPGDGTMANASMLDPAPFEPLPNPWQSHVRRTRSGRRATPVNVRFSLSQTAVKRAMPLKGHAAPRRRRTRPEPTSRLLTATWGPIYRKGMLAFTEELKPPMQEQKAQDLRARRRSS